MVLGVALGLASAIALSRFLDSALYGVRGTDPVTYATVAALLGFIALGAVLLPARRAAATDPMSLLRED